MHPLELIPGLTFVRPTSRGVHERGGRYQSIMEDGLNFYIPIYDNVRKVNVTEQMADVETTEMITKDNLNVDVDAQVYYRVRKTTEDVKKAVYEVDDYDYQIVNLAQTTARAVIGNMKFEKVNNNRNELNTKLREELEEQTNGWGLEVVRVEIQEITPPKKVQNSMNEVVEAENKKESAKDFANAKETEADGERRAEIKKAEGKKRAAVLEAEGKAKAIQKEAKAQAKEIQLVNNSISEHFTNKPQEFKKLETVQNSLRNGSKYVIDSDSDMTAVLSEVGGVTPIDDEKDVEDLDGQLDIDMSDAAEKMTDEDDEEGKVI